MAEKSKQSLNLPVDIVYEILLCLSVKKLSMLKCVCKPWCSLISSSVFQDDHHRRNHLLLTTRYQYHDGIVTLHLSTYTISTEVLIKKRTITVPSAPWFYHNYFSIPIQSCRGLICIAGRKTAPLLICNPSTEELVVLPTPKLGHGYDVCIGFGYAESTREFKVVMFFERREQSHCIVFTLGSNEGWREARSPRAYYVFPGAAPFLHGALHLLNIYYIGAFDVESEKWRGIQISLPQDLPKKENISEGMRLTMLGEELCLVAHPANTKDEMILWVLKDYQNGRWVNGYNILLSSIERPRNCLIYCIARFRTNPLVIMNDGSILLSSYWGIGEEVVCYDPKVKAVTRKIENYDEGYCSAGFYREIFSRLR